MKNYRVDTVTYMTRSKRCSQNTGTCFLRMDYVGISGYFNYRLTQVPIRLYAVNHIGMVLTSLRLCKIWWKGWKKMVWWKRMNDHGDHWWF